MGYEKDEARFPSRKCWEASMSFDMVMRRQCCFLSTSTPALQSHRTTTGHLTSTSLPSQLHPRPAAFRNHPRLRTSSFHSLWDNSNMLLFTSQCSRQAGENFCTFRSFDNRSHCPGSSQTPIIVGTMAKLTSTMPIILFFSSSCSAVPSSQHTEYSRLQRQHFHHGIPHVRHDHEQQHTPDETVYTYIHC